MGIFENLMVENLKNIWEEIWNCCNQNILTLKKLKMFDENIWTFEKRLIKIWKRFDWNLKTIWWKL